ncbi:hypothetical protein [Neokomagataea anthophila]|uniref:Uncharacterized protein n=1 Tax=Neokomagataea anthophila TaxID=2826925 RepID=A0ABS5EAW2_9PROT|nr:hypothetical protein [Neokomagataea anthophila]MBR0560678.1 hypothetical protein [Neokomagataea anthophila]
MKWLKVVDEKIGSIIVKYNSSFVYFVYSLYILRFFTIISVFIGFFVSLLMKRNSQGVAIHHVERLLNLFYIDVIITCSMLGLFGVCYCIAPPSEPGMWELVYILPVGIFLAWNVVLLISLVNGVCAFAARQSEHPLGMRTVRF